VYPIARGAPLLLIAVLGALFLGERLPALGYVGIALLIGGIYLASLPSLADWSKPLRALKHRPTQIALLAALCVTAYTLLDKIGVRYAQPMVYNWWVYASIAVGYMPFVLSRANRDSTTREFRMNWRRILIASFATVGSYLAALIGLSMTAASYVASVRATSVVMGALLGWLFLKEQLGALRVFAAALMVVGLVLIAVG
jgi:drug/metabolite transporter (DMT)-like permease